MLQKTFFLAEFTGLNGCLRDRVSSTFHNVSLWYISFLIPWNCGPHYYISIPPPPLTC